MVPRIVVRNYGLLGIRVIYPTAGNIAGSDLSLPTEPAFFGLDESFHTEMVTPTQTVALQLLQPILRSTNRSA